MKRLIPSALLIFYVVLFSALAVSPFDRTTWWSENIPIVLIVALLVLLYPRFQFSNASYLMMAVLIYLHTIGGHYTFERVPFDLITNLFGFSRNHYDRVAHFSVGFYAYPIAEVLWRQKLTNSKIILALFPVFAILSAASCYEIIEWLYAAFSDPAAGAAFLGSQGDIWDAQKDMLADGLGALVATALFLYQWRGAALETAQYAWKEGRGQL